MNEKSNCRNDAGVAGLARRLDDTKELFAAQYEALERVVDERDRLYKERAEQFQKYVETALAALERQTEESFTSAGRAVDKAELAQKEYNVRSNEFRAALDDAQKNMIARPEALAEFERTRERFDAVQQEIIVLRDFQNMRRGQSVGVSGTVALIISAIGILGVLFGVVAHFIK